MSKNVDYPELRAQLQVLNNKELHQKCVEHGMKVPVADSTRDVIIRKLIKSITGDPNIASPKANKKQPSTPIERRKTANVSVHVSSDEKEVERQSRTEITKTRTRTQSPKGHNVSFDTTPNNNRRSMASATTAAEPKTSTIKQKQTTQRMDTNANSGVGLSNSARILPIEVDWTEQDDYNIEVRRNDASSLNKDVNLNHGINFDASGMRTPLQVEQTRSSYQAVSNNLGFGNYSQDVCDNTPLSGYKAPSHNLGYSQTRNTTYQEDENITPRHGYIATPPESTYNRTSYGFYSPGSPPTVFNNENKASHSSTLGNQFGSGTSPPTAQENVFKRPIALSKSNTTNTSYNQADAQRLYPRLPNDLPSPPPYSTSPPTSPESQQSSNRSNRAPSLTKSGVMTTSYYQEISPVKDVKHIEVESGDEHALIDNGAGDYERPHINTPSGGTNYERSSYLAGLQRGAETQHLPFEPHLQSTLRDTLDATPRYANSPLSRETYVPHAAATKPSSPPPAIKRYTTNSSSNTSYTRSIDEPDSGSEEEKLSGDEIYVQDSEEEEEYIPGNKKIYSSFGSNKIQERLPYRRSTTTGSSSSPRARYNHSPVGRPLINTVGADDYDGDDLNTSLANFIAAMDRKYHIKQMLYMFAIFAAAVFVYVVFIEKAPADEVLLPTKVHP
ncbi:LEM domain-containing protein Bocksbeutel [Eurosta solidaginis]|uniref:LEM domain-containing protein Bocksbeutel n=1 Tax=Eurosta solidaginis TaxID=178769 RepID=UPI003530E7D7